MARPGVRGRLPPDLAHIARLYGTSNPQLCQPLLAALFLACPAYYHQLQGLAASLGPGPSSAPAPPQLAVRMR